MASITLKTCLTPSCVHVQKLKIIFNDDNQVLDLEPTVWRKIKQKRTEHPKWEIFAYVCQKSQNHLLNSKNDKIIFQYYIKHNMQRWFKSAKTTMFPCCY